LIENYSQISRDINRQEQEEEAMRKQKGFTLIELLIVIAIILIIAAIAIPNLMRSKMAANEASAVASVRTIVTGQITYASTYPSIGFATTLAELGPPSSGSTPTSGSSMVIDNLLATGAKSGYTLAMTGDTTDTPGVYFTVTNTPVSTSTGTRQFCSDQSGVIRYVSGTSGCTSTSSPLQ
jgi:prepilin-type N-terminal cleavage/methylation domain-containing protein